MTWRPLRPGELDHEALWLAVSVAALLGAWVWLRLALPIPQCTFHRLAGMACPTCGLTRCLRYAFHGGWKAAATINPLGLVGLGIIVAFDLYATAVLIFRLPRLRFDSLSPRVSTGVRLTTIAAILANWAWLVWSGS